MLYTVLALSTLFLAAGALVVMLKWGENFGGKGGAVAEGEGDEASSEPKGGGDSTQVVKEATQAMLADKKILLVGAVQALFEGAMYIFVLQWPPALKAALGAGVAVPFGKIFSCFMVCCMIGSSTFSALSSRVKLEDSVLLMLVLGRAMDGLRLSYPRLGAVCR